ncbi:hypothetical protein Dimus_023591 [Dionaea muscipula]
MNRDLTNKDNYNQLARWSAVTACPVVCHHSLPGKASTLACPAFTTACPVKLPPLLARRSPSPSRSSSSPRAYSVKTTHLPARLLPPLFAQRSPSSVFPEKPFIACSGFNSPDLTG